MLNNAARSLSLAAFFVLTTTLGSHAEQKSKSGKIIVLTPQDLPDEARLPGESFFLDTAHQDNVYLYVEQQNGSALTLFDVTDPAHIKVKAVARLAVSGPFDFIRDEGQHGELVRFRDGNRLAVLDVTKVEKPVLHDFPALKASRDTIVTDKEVASSLKYMPAVPKDYDILDTSSTDHPEHVMTVPLVQHQLVNSDTGTVFLLARNGLTVVRRPDVEETYATQQLQLKSN